jgi:hypothetical protein
MLEKSVYKSLKILSLILFEKCANSNVSQLTYHVKELTGLKTLA